MKKIIIVLVLIFKMLICSAQLDVGIISIENPGLYAPADTQVTVEVVIKNFGTIPVTIVTVSYQINSNTPVTGAWTGSLLPQDTVHFTFLTKLFPPWGNAFFMCAFTTLLNDNNHNNNLNCRVVGIVLTSGNENEKNNYKVYPTPADNLVNFQLYSDEDCNVKIRIFNSVGTEIDNFYYPIKNGNNIIEYKTNHLPKGIYFYSLESLKNKYSGKFIINR